MSDRPIDLVIQVVQETERGLRGGFLVMPRSIKRLISSESLAEELVRFHLARLEPLRHRVDVVNECPYKFALIGLTNVGKSTILRALFGADIAVHGAGPTTPFPVLYGYGTDWKIELARTGANFERTRYGNSDMMATALKELVQRAPADVKRLRVEGPLDILRYGLEIADTPGFGAAQAGPNAGQHRARLEQFLKGPIHQIFLCVAASDAWVIRPEEQEYYERFHTSCGDVIVNKWRGSESEQLEYATRYRALLPRARFHFTNAKRAETRKAFQRATVGDDGLSQLRTCIESSADAATRAASCDRDLADAWRDLLDDLAQQFGVKQVPWHEFAFRRLLAGVPQESALRRVLGGLA